MEQLDVIYGDTKIQVPADTAIESLKLAMAENFPELKDATVVTTDSAVVFSAKAGTKGLEVIYGDTKVDVPDDTELESLKLAMAENFPELKDASVVTTEGAVVFSAKAGTKGKLVLH